MISKHGMPFAFHTMRLAFPALLMAVLAVPLAAQSVELHPYAGGFWPNEPEIGKLQDGFIYGLKAGFFVGDNFQLDGNVGYINHFQMERPENILALDRPPIRAVIWEAGGSWNFLGARTGGVRIAPYLTLGLGGLTAIIDGFDDAFISGGGLVFDPVLDAFVPNPAPVVILETRSTFFTFSYGGGVKALNLWGPLGLRGDFRGRTMPNFYSNTVHWPELTGGLIFTWGE